MLLTIISVVNLGFIFSVFFIERKQPSEVAAWIMLLLLMPILGFVLYLIAGSTLRLKWSRKKKKQQIVKQYPGILELGAPCRGTSDTIESEWCRDIITLHSTYGGSVYTDRNSVEIFESGEFKYNRMFDDLKRAKTSIHVLYFSIYDDETGREMTDILADMARQGVEVRLLYDRMGCFFTSRSLFRKVRQAGGYVSAFRPMYIDVNFRNHRKLVIIDGEIGYTGGMNIGNKYRGKHKVKTPWRDTQVRLTGSSVHSLQQCFWIDWLMTNILSKYGLPASLEPYFPEFAAEEQSQIGVQVVTGGPDADSTIELGYFRVISSAQSRLWIQTPYVIPNERILNALKASAAAGVDIRIMIPEVLANRLLKQLSYYYIDELISYGIKIYCYQGYLHAKTMIADGKLTCIGSVNLDVRSLELNDEICVYFYNEQFTAAYEQIFAKDLQVCDELNYDAFMNRGIVSKVQESISRLISPIF